MDILQQLGEYLSSVIANPLVGELVAGAVDGIIIGLIVGAIVWAVMQAPDTLGRGLLFAILIGIVVIIWEFAQISAFVQGGLFQALSENEPIGYLFWDAGVNTLTAMLIGMALGVGSQVPHHMVRGGIVGVFLGALVGAVLRAGLDYLGIVLHVLIYRGAIILGVWGLIATVGDRG
jgi:hypothetical protein